VPLNGGVVPLLEILATMAGKARATLDGLYGREIFDPTTFDTASEVQIKDGRATTTPIGPHGVLRGPRV
jgi:hypothetical protein